MEAALTTVASAACLCILCSLSSGCLVYGAVVAAVVATVSLLAWVAWAVHFQLFVLTLLYSSIHCFRPEKIKQKRRTKTSPAGLLGLILVNWPIRGNISSYLIFNFVFNSCFQLQNGALSFFASKRSVWTGPETEQKTYHVPGMSYDGHSPYEV